MSNPEIRIQGIDTDNLQLVTDIRTQVRADTLTLQQALLLLEIAKEQRWPSTPADLVKLLSQNEPYYSGKKLLQLYAYATAVIDPEKWYEVLPATDTFEMRELPPLEIVLLLAQAYEAILPTTEVQ
jgi:hypothetical protein